MDMPGAQAPALPLLDSLRRVAQARWISLLLIGVCAATLALALLLRVPDTRVLADAGALRAAVFIGAGHMKTLSL